MKTSAVRLYGKNDLRLEAFELPEMKDDEILAHVISDSICMSSHKALLQGAEHKRVPNDIHINPTIIGHEFSGKIIEVGKKWKHKFTAGPGNPAFAATLNFYNVHYNSTHIVGTSGGNSDDMIESLELMSQGRIKAASLITHIGGLNAVIETTRHLPEIPGGKKLIYTNIDLELVALTDLATTPDETGMLKALSAIIHKHNGLWSVEAENYLLQHAKQV